MELYIQQIHLKNALFHTYAMNVHLNIHINSATGLANIAHDNLTPKQLKNDYLTNEHDLICKDVYVHSYHKLRINAKKLLGITKTFPPNDEIKIKLDPDNKQVYVSCNKYTARLSCLGFC